MKFIHWKRIIKIIIFIFLFWIAFELGFFRGEQQSPNAYNREMLDKTEKVYINCMDKLQNR